MRRQKRRHQLQPSGSQPDRQEELKRKRGQTATGDEGQWSGDAMPTPTETRVAGQFGEV